MSVATEAQRTGAAALTDVIYERRYDTCHAPIIDVFRDDIFTRPSDEPASQRSRRGYEQLRHVAARLGPAQALVRDPHRLFALFDWSATFAPDLIPVMSGHYTLTVGAILALGEGRAELDQYLDELDDAASVGVFLLTELGYGSNVFDMETQAIYDPQTRTFQLHTPTAAAQKFMPNVGAASVPKLVVVAARLLVGGEDCGVFPFIVRLRGSDGAVQPGVRITPLLDKPFVAMDNAVISFDGVEVPYANLLTGGIAELATDGTFRSAVARRWRFTHTIEQLQTGRIALSASVLASARAGLVITIRYAQQRRTSAAGRRTVAMLEHRLVQRGLMRGLARIYAATFFANQVKRAFAEKPRDRDRTALLAMVAKPMLSRTAFEVLQECRERCGAQGFLSVNRIADYLGQCQGIITAEGENQVLDLTAGWQLFTRGEPIAAARCDIPRTAEDLARPPVWRRLLAEREQGLRAQIDAGLHASRGTSDRFERLNEQAVAVAALADAHAHRLALDALLEAIETIDDESTRHALLLVAKLYVLDRVAQHAGWYLEQQVLGPAQTVEIELEINRTCAALTSHARLLTDAFAIPDDVLQVPIASPDYITAWDLRDAAEPTRPAPPAR